MILLAGTHREEAGTGLQREEGINQAKALSDDDLCGQKWIRTQTHALTPAAAMLQQRVLLGRAWTLALNTTPLYWGFPTTADQE